jgi:hypothetical protein
MPTSSGCNFRERVIEVVVRCANLLAYAEKALAGWGVILKMCHGAHGGPHATSVLDNTDVR